MRPLGYLFKKKSIKFNLKEAPKKMIIEQLPFYFGICGGQCYLFQIPMCA